MAEITASFLKPFFIQMFSASLINFLMSSLYKPFGGQNINIFHPINHEVGVLVEKAVSEKVAEIFSESYEQTEPDNTW